MNSVKRCIVALCTFAVLLAGSAKGAQAQLLLTALTVSGSPAPFTITTAVAGSQPAALTNSVTTYFVKAKNLIGAQKITAQLDAPMPLGTTLTVQLVAPPGATSLGAVSLDATVRDVVINIAKENGANYGITYVFSATVAAGVVPTQTRTVTFTETTYP